MNAQCESVPVVLCNQLNPLFTALNAVACNVGDCTALISFGCLFVGVVCCYCICCCCNASAASAAAAAVNLFDFTAEFSCFVSVIEGILDVL